MVVYRWRVSRELMTKLERVARARHVRVSTLLNRIMRDWLAVNGFASVAEDSSKGARQILPRKHSG